MSVRRSIGCSDSRILGLVFASESYLSWSSSIIHNESISRFATAFLASVALTRKSAPRWAAHLEVGILIPTPNTHCRIASQFMNGTQYGNECWCGDEDTDLEVRGPSYALSRARGALPKPAVANRLMLTSCIIEEDKERQLSGGKIHSQESKSQNTQ